MRTIGDRVSISFKHGNDESVTLFSHWGGYAFVKTAERYAKKLIADNKRRGGMTMPLDRCDVETVMVDFIRYLTSDMDRVESDLYLGKDCNDGDNSDNGHFVIDMETGEAEK